MLTHKLPQSEYLQAFIHRVAHSDETLGVLGLIVGCCLFVSETILPSVRLAQVLGSGVDAELAWEHVGSLAMAGTRTKFGLSPAKFSNENCFPWHHSSKNHCTVSAEYGDAAQSKQSGRIYLTRVPFNCRCWLL